MEETVFKDIVAGREYVKYEGPFYMYMYIVRYRVISK